MQWNAESTYFRRSYMKKLSFKWTSLQFVLAIMRNTTSLNYVQSWWWSVSLQKKQIGNWRKKIPFLWICLGLTRCEILSMYFAWTCYKINMKSSTDISCTYPEWKGCRQDFLNNSQKLTLLFMHGCMRSACSGMAYHSDSVAPWMGPIIP